MGPRPSPNLSGMSRAVITVALVVVSLGSGFGRDSAAANSRIRCDITGTAKADTLRGTPRSNVICGRAGRDTIRGLGGDDILLGGSSADLILGGTGNDFVSGGAGSDVLGGGAGDDEVEGLEGNDTIDGDAGVDRIRGGKGNDHLAGEEGDGDRVDGELGDDFADGGDGSSDVVIGGLGVDELHGGNGDQDLIEGNGSGDLLDGGAGAHDIASFAAAPLEGFPIRGEEIDFYHRVARGPDGFDRFQGVEDLIGSAGPDVIDESMVGPLGVHRIDGGPGNDYLRMPDAEIFGGSGIDFCGTFAATHDCEGEAPPQSADTGPTSVELSRGFVGSTLSVIGSDRSNALRVTASGGNYLIEDSAAGVKLIGDGCAINGPNAVECPAPTDLRPTVLALAGGSDSLDVEGPIPVIANGGAGDDTLAGGDAPDILDAGLQGGTDTLSGGGSTDALIAGPGLGHLYGGDGPDLLVAFGACGGSLLNGGDGIDTASFARSATGVVAQVDRSAFDPVDPDCEAVTLRNDESLEGSDLDDKLIGDSGPNSFLGHEGHDAFFGLGGRDFINSADGLSDRRIDCGPGPDSVVQDEGLDPRPRSCSAP